MKTTKASTNIYATSSYHASREKAKKDDSLLIENVFKGLNTQNIGESNNQSMNVLKTTDVNRM